MGLFVAAALALIGYITLRISDLSLIAGGYYVIYATMKNAEGVVDKTPVQMAGIPIGVVGEITLTPDRQALVQMKIKEDVKVPASVEAQVRLRGVLGDTYIELLPKEGDAAPLAPGGEVAKVLSRADYQELYGEVSEITENIRDLSQALKDYTVSDQSHFAKILKSMEIMTNNMAQFSSNNMENMNAVVVNLRSLTNDLKNLSGGSSKDIQEAIHRIALITEKIEQGEGTIGQLMTDDSTIKKANKALDSIGELTSGFSRMETEIGWHMEYLGGTQDVKNYVSIALKPRPDKYFLFEVVHDPDPPGSSSSQLTTVTANGVTSTIMTETESFDEIRFSAQLAKTFKDLTLRGGLIESTGGFGLDYNKGPFSVQFSAFDFTADRPHLKVLGAVNFLPSVYLLTGLDDFISNQHPLNWFVGAGVRLTDRDVKSLVGGASLAR